MAQEEDINNEKLSNSNTVNLDYGARRQQY